MGEGGSFVCWREEMAPVGESKGVAGEARGTGEEARDGSCCGGGDITMGAGVVVGEARDEPKADRDRFWLIFRLRSLWEGNFRCRALSSAL